MHADTPIVKAQSLLGRTCSTSNVTLATLGKARVAQAEFIHPFVQRPRISGPELHAHFVMFVLLQKVDCPT